MVWDYLPILQMLRPGPLTETGSEPKEQNRTATGKAVLEPGPRRPAQQCLLGPRLLGRRVRAQLLSEEEAGL